MRHDPRGSEPPDTVILTGEDSARQIRQLGLDPEWLSNAALRGVLAHRDNTGRYAPPILGPFNAWGVSNTFIRVAACPHPHNWVPENRRGVAFTVSPNRLVAVTALAGCASTGDPTLNPSTKVPRGTSWDDILARISTNYELFGEGFGPQVAAPTAASGYEQAAWILLFRWAMRDSGLVIRAELSLPFAKNEHSYIDCWSVRAILPEINRTTGTPRPNVNSTEPTQLVEPSITLKRKGA